jgi:hypothetical protein
VLMPPRRRPMRSFLGPQCNADRLFMTRVPFEMLISNIDEPEVDITDQQGSTPIWGSSFSRSDRGRYLAGVVALLRRTSYGHVRVHAPTTSFLASVYQTLADVNA